MLTHTGNFLAERLKVFEKRHVQHRQKIVLPPIRIIDIGQLRKDFLDRSQRRAHDVVEIDGHALKLPPLASARKAAVRAADTEVADVVEAQPG